MVTKFARKKGITFSILCFIVPALRDIVSGVIRPLEGHLMSHLPYLECFQVKIIVVIVALVSRYSSSFSIPGWYIQEWESVLYKAWLE